MASVVLWQPTQLQPSHVFPIAKQSQYSFRHFDFEQLQVTFFGSFRFCGTTGFCTAAGAASIDLASTVAAVLNFSRVFVMSAKLIFGTDLRCADCGLTQSARGVGGFASAGDRQASLS